MLTNFAPLLAFQSILGLNFRVRFPIIPSVLDFDLICLVHIIHIWTVIWTETSRRHNANQILFIHVKDVNICSFPGIACPEEVFWVSGISLALCLLVIFVFMGLALAESCNCGGSPN